MKRTPCFHALAAFACQSNPLYRVDVQLHPPIFIRSGSGSDDPTGAWAGSRIGAASFGLAGAIVAVTGAAMTRVLDGAAVACERQRVLDRAAVAALMTDHPPNLSAHIVGFPEARIGPRSDHLARASSDPWSSGASASSSSHL